jgi:transglutaminase-like putative cysteine protease
VTATARLRSDGGPDARADARDHRDGLDVLATLALAAYSFIAALGFDRVFTDWQFVPDVLVIVLVGHGSSLLMRRLHVNALVSIAVSAAALVWAVAWVAYPDTFAAIFPTRETWDIAWADLGLVRDQFSHAVAPVEYVGGWTLLAAVGTAFAVFTADTFAFHARARGEALVPGGVLFVFVAALGADQHRVVLTLALIAAGFLAAAMLRMRFAQPSRTSLGRPRHPLALMLPAAILGAAAVVFGTWIIGPRLPGADADPLFDTHTNTGGITEVPSPLVDIRSRLVNRADTLLFEVAATQPRYWRVIGLPAFDGNTWGLPSRSVDDVNGELADPAPGSTENRQEITIAALRGNFVPAAAEPVQADGPDLQWNAETSALLRADGDLETGDKITVVSAEPSFSADVLRTTSSDSPPDAIYLALPADFPQSVSVAATTVTAGASTTYDKMIALQTWFRTEFRYSLDVPQGHSTSAIEAFLRQRVGYCEQFAGTFAAMARSLGIPARVAVGFTPGTALDDGSLQVLGKNSHAWPEIWFDGLGWVPFEPTPGRGEPGAEGYTGVAAAQDDSGPGPATGDDGGDAAATADVPPPTAPVIPFDQIPQPDENVLPTGLDASGFSTTVPDQGINWLAVAIVTGFLLLLLLLPAVVRKWRRAHPPSDPARQMTTLWWRALGAVEATGCRVDPSLTPLEQARAISPRLPVAARPLKSLAEAATAATYATDDEVRHLGDGQAAGEPGPRRWCRQVERIAADSMTTGGKLRRYFTVWA